MNKYLLKYATILLLGLINIQAVAQGVINADEKRATEIRESAWNTNDDDFQVTAIPEKWSDKSAVIIALSNNLSYKKTFLSNSLEYNRLTHERIMLLDKKALEEYAYFNIPAGGVYGNERYAFYAGFKIIKPSGEIIKVPVSDAVKEEREVNSRGFDNYKIVLPNLEIGDIVDYYIAEDRIVSVYNVYYAFDPMIFQLNEDYPVMNQKISFDVLRKCYINLKTLNGAPEFKLTEDAEKDKNFYYLEDGERESAKDIRWLYKNRELPTIKLRVTYAKGMALSMPSFLGEPGVLKSNVDKWTLKRVVGSAFANTIYPYRKYMRKNYKKVKDKEFLAKEAYYVYRNRDRVYNAEYRTLNGNEANPDDQGYKMLKALNAYYKQEEIPHDIMIGVPRSISTIEDIILEEELIFMIRVNTENPFYIGRYGNHAITGEIADELQDITMYQVDGLEYSSRWNLQTVKTPVIPHTDNKTSSTITISDLDLTEETTEAFIERKATGANRIFYQNVLLDVYDYRANEQKKYQMEDLIEEYNNKIKTSLYSKRDEFMAGREERKEDYLKQMAELDYDLEIEYAKDLTIKSMGRTEEAPSFEYSFTLGWNDLVKRAGRNYLLDVGKLLENQVQITNDERERDYNIYMSHARSYDYAINVTIPEGYSVQGIEELNVAVENETGGFSVNATMVGNVLKLKSSKHYTSNFVEKEQWAEMLAFLDEAYDFTTKQVLLKKN